MIQKCVSTLERAAKKNDRTDPASAFESEARSGQEESGTDDKIRFFDERLFRTENRLTKNVLVSPCDA
ncbi:MAG: hypothetical protein ACRC2T_02710 [Thermoguttaceae bacterium]